MFDKSKHIIYVLVLAFLIRILAVKQTIFGDEFGFLESVRTMGPYGLNPVTVSSYLVPVIHKIESSIFGLNPIVFKFFAIVFGTLTIYFAYLLAKRLFDEKTAIVASVLLALCSYHIFNSTIIGSDEPHLLLLYTSALYFYVRFLQEKKNKWFWTSGVLLGLSLLVKQSGLFILPIIFFYELYSSKKFISSVKHSALLLIIGLAFFSIYPILSILAGQPFFLLGLMHTLNKITQVNFNLSILAIQYLLSVIWMGPLLLAFIFLSFKDFKKHSLLSIWTWVILFVYTFVNTEATKPLDRYFTILAVPLCIIGAKWISDFKLNKIEWKKVGIWLVIGIIALFVINNLNGDYLSFYPKEAYLEKAKSLDFNFFIPVSGGSGPIGFYLNAMFIVTAFVVGLLLFASTLKKWRYSRLCLIAFLGLGIAYNVVLTSEHLFSPSNPNIDKANKELIDFAKSNQLKEPIFVFRNPAYLYYLGANYGGPYKNITILDYYIFDRLDIEKEIKDKKPTVLVVDFPKINRNIDFWKVLQRCRTLKEFSDKGVKLAYALDCSSLS